ncbi:hypothetical protein LCM23_14730 [Cytobacillus kochii]|uniref:hypothetical protein n=1 Tax=Cytobacillus kochii TaxID=859143 RepID=UPI001CD5F4BE|nr:hypothetical protein [Cytobacillus kochii]MCA1027351.1 hypothetical protein [Cytobacillus kochii]
MDKYVIVLKDEKYWNKKKKQWVNIFSQVTPLELEEAQNIAEDLESEYDISIKSFNEELIKYNK